MHTFWHRFKVFLKHNSSWRDLKCTLLFYQCNPHSIPGIASLLCKFGRHEYEPFYVFKNGDCVKVDLQCFYCEKLKQSSFSQGDEN